MQTAQNKVSTASEKVLFVKGLLAHDFNVKGQEPKTFIKEQMEK